MTAAATRTRLVSFLGTGKYEPTRHRLPDESLGAETKYVCRALAEFVRADEIAIVATAEAKAAHGEPLFAELRAANLPKPDFRSVPLGKTQGELWQQFDATKQLLRAEKGTHIDITHAFRSQPFFAAAVTAFVRAVDPEPAPVRVFYAAFEARDRDEGITPIWDLTPFVDLLDWAQAMMLFLRTGRSADIADKTEAFGRELAKRHWGENPNRTRPQLDGLGRELKVFGANLEMIRTGSLLIGDGVGSAARVARSLDEARAAASALPPLADVLGRIRSDMVEPLLGASDHLANEAGHKAMAGLARLYLDMGRWAEATAVLREGWVTRHTGPEGAFAGRDDGAPAADAAARRSAEARWRREEGNLARTIAQIRNDIGHAGFNPRPDPAPAVQKRVRDLAQRFSALPPEAEPPTSAPIFVNLSNHPSADWSEAQRTAALGLAPAIRDWLLPEVPPESDAAAIDVLADDIIARLIGEIPSVTHAMVQGEFTLAHALVRRLQERGIQCLAATSRRLVIEEARGVKTTRFEFVRFREYC